MRTKSIGVLLPTAAMLGLTVLSPLAVSAQGRRLAQESHHRQQTKNQWRNLAIGGGALGVIGLLTHNNVLTYGGLAGGLYSLSRYEHDRKSQSRIDQARANYYSRPYVYHNGVRYHRHIVTRHGHQYYQYRRG
jgi:hypothetical protein